MGKNVLIDPIECLLRKIGKEIFLRILYPEIKKNRNITVEELASKYPKYASFSINSQRTRLNNANKIFALNKLKEAFQIIMDSERISQESRNLAFRYYNQL